MAFMKLVLIIAFLYIPITAQESDIISKPDSSVKDSLLYFPSMEVGYGIGIPWLLQSTFTYSPNDLFFIQPRISLGIGLEWGIAAGTQFLIRRNMKLRFAIGFSNMIVPEEISDYFPEQNEILPYVRIGELQVLGNNKLGGAYVSCIFI